MDKPAAIFSHSAYGCAAGLPLNVVVRALTLSNTALSRRITDSPAVKRFRTLATEFCAVIDDRSSYSAALLLRRLHPLLPSLMHAAIELPEPVRSGSLPANRDYVEVWQPLYTSLGEQLGGYNYYWEIFDPYTLSEPIEGSLADDLSDMYLDLHEGLRLWEGADASLRRTIVWEWRFGYESHWGHHVIHAMRAIHALLNVHHIEAPDAVSPSAAP